MAFDKNAFMQARFIPRTQAVPVPGLADFFPKEEIEEGEVQPVPQWIVRGMDANEFARCQEEADKRDKLGTLVQAISMSGPTSAKVQKVREALGIVADEVPGEVAKRLEMLTIASIDPVIPIEVAVRVAETRPIEFYDLTNVIITLTGQGKDIEKKSIPSGDQSKSGDV